MKTAIMIPLLALSLVEAACASAPAARDTRATYRFGDWRLHLAKDGFTNTTVCRLRDGGARVERGRLIWSVGAHVDSTHAVYRIDAGAPRLQSALSLPATANMVNPSNGYVVVPVAELAGARLLQVRPNPHAGVRTLRVEGLGEALATADRLGCARPANAPATPPVS